MESRSLTTPQSAFAVLEHQAGFNQPTAPWPAQPSTVESNQARSGHTALGTSLDAIRQMMVAWQAWAYPSEKRRSGRQSPRICSGTATGASGLDHLVDPTS